MIFSRVYWDSIYIQVSAEGNPVLRDLLLERFGSVWLAIVIDGVASDALLLSLRLPQKFASLGEAVEEG